MPNTWPGRETVRLPLLWGQGLGRHIDPLAKAGGVVGQVEQNQVVEGVVGRSQGKNGGDAFCRANQFEFSHCQSSSLDRIAAGIA